MAYKKPPNFPVWAALEYLGADDVPHVVGRKNYKKMRCPFHDDTNPSAHLDEFGFHCFVCGVSGDAIKLVRREGHNYQAAIAILQERTGGENRDSAPEAGGRDWGVSLLG